MNIRNEWMNVLAYMLRTNEWSYNYVPNSPLSSYFVVHWPFNVAYRFKSHLWMNLNNELKRLSTDECLIVLCLWMLEMTYKNCREQYATCLVLWAMRRMLWEICHGLLQFALSLHYGFLRRKGHWYHYLLSSVLLPWVVNLKVYLFSNFVVLLVCICSDVTLLSIYFR